MRVLVTGANGFIGRAVVETFARDNRFAVRAATRRNSRATADIEGVTVGDLSAATDWRAALKDVDVVIHAAGRAHRMHEAAGSAESLDTNRRVNVDATISLARQAVEAGVQRLVFLSSIKVNGESTESGKPFRPDDIPDPRDAYGISKFAAEQALFALAEKQSLEVTIIRPVLVYGPGVKANFRSMMNWIARGIPLPFGAIQNRRSLVALDNLVSLISACATHPAAANEVFLVSDGEDLSTSELLRRTAAAMGKQAKLVPVPSALLKLAAQLVGKGELASRLCDSLQVDIEKTQRLLGWERVISVDEGLQRTVAADRKSFAG